MRHVEQEPRSRPAALALKVIGRIYTPFAEPAGAPIQSIYGRGVAGRVVVGPRYAPALDDIEGFERLWLVYWLDRVSCFRPRVVPYRDDKEHGLFATRSPCRPNPIGLSVVRLVGREGHVLHVADLDILDGTPLLDLKPYVPEFDACPGSRAGWFDGCSVDRRTADGRFHRGAPARAARQRRAAARSAGGDDG